jgi:hypothetical protein
MHGSIARANNVMAISNLGHSVNQGRFKVAAACLPIVAFRSLLADTPITMMGAIRKRSRCRITRRRPTRMSKGPVVRSNESLNTASPLRASHACA